MPEIAFIMGKSSSGKDHIFKALIEDETLGLSTITMYTTRPMRAGETDGVEYYFVDDNKVCEFEKNNKIIEMRKYQTVYGEWKYFTADDGQIESGSGKRYIVIGTIEAYNKFVEYFGKECMLPIYIEVEDGERLIRAIRSLMNIYETFFTLHLKYCLKGKKACLRCASLLRVANGAAAVRIPGRSPVPSP